MSCLFVQIHAIPFWQLHPLRRRFVPCPVEDSFKKACVEEWVFISDVPSEGPSSTDQGEVIPETPRVSKHASLLPWEPAKPHDKACFWERIEAPQPAPCGHDQSVISFIHVSLVPFQSVIFVFIFELLQTLMEINSLAGPFLKILFFKKKGHARSVVPFARIFPFVFVRVHNAGSSGVVRRPERHLVRVPGRRHEAGAVLYTLAPRAALVHRRPGPCNARDALGALGSRRELSRVHSRHIASLFPCSRVVLMSATIASGQRGAWCPSSSAVVHICVVLHATASPDDRFLRGKPASMRHDVSVVMLTNTFLRSLFVVSVGTPGCLSLHRVTVRISRGLRCW